MIEILGIRSSHLPDGDRLERMMDRSLLAAWQAQHKRLRDPEGRRASLAGLLLLQAMGMRGDLIYDQVGRPCFGDGRVDFNITHTDGAVFCAVERLDGEASVTARVGLDAENAVRIGRLQRDGMARRWFSGNECAQYFADPSADAFLQIWTRKEALIKWTGEGLAALGRADTTHARSVYGVDFRSYAEGAERITLCYRREATPPESIRMLDGEMLVRLCGR